MSIIGNPLVTTNYISDSFSGDASTVAFTLSQAPASAASIAVYISGLYQIPTSAYSISGTTLTFTGAPPTGTNNITVLHLGVKSATLVPVNGSVTPQMLSNANVVYWSASNNNIGIGNVTPTSLLTVTGTATLGNTTITGFANVTSTIQGGAGLTIAGAASGITTLAAGNTTITGFANVSTDADIGGNVGIGISSSSASKLNVNYEASFLVDNNNRGIVGWYDSDKRLGFGTINASTTYFNTMSIKDGKIGIGTTSPGYSLDLGAMTDAIELPIGTTAQRPASTAGLLRYNSSKQALEGVVSTQWSRDWQPLTMAPCFYGFDSIDTSGISGWKTIRMNPDFNCGLNGASVYDSSTGRFTANEEGWYVFIFGHGHVNGSHGAYRQNIYHGTFGDIAAQWQPSSDRTTITAVSYMNGTDHWVAPNVYHDNTNHGDDNGGRVNFFAVFRIIGADN